VQPSMFSQPFDKFHRLLHPTAINFGTVDDRRITETFHCRDTASELRYSHHPNEVQLTSNISSD